MLKVFLGFVVSVVVLLSSAYVPQFTERAYAASAKVLITQIQAGGVGVPTQEFIVLYNNSPDEVDVTGWCLTNKSGAAVACLNPPEIGQTIYLPAYEHAVVASDSFAMGLPSGAVTVTYTPTNQNVGSITGSNDTVSLVDEMGSVVDVQTWTTSISAGMQFERHGVGSPVLYTDTDTTTDWSVTIPGLLPVDETRIGTTIVEHEVVPLTISEVLPNATGADDGKEFIELFNPNDEIVSLSDYELFVGLHYENSYYFPDGAAIEPHGYSSFTNTDIPFTLLNSSSRVALTLRNGSIINETPAYTNPKDGQSWANIHDEWQYTNQPTPSATNLATDDSIIESGATLVAFSQPCAENQYRSPDTNRCRLIASSSVTGLVTPCKEGQYRSEETNRCRAVASDVKTVTPCKEGEERNLETNRCRKIVVAVTATPCKAGQERNPDTNRCRTIVKMPSAEYGVLGAETKSGGAWYVWAAVGGVLLLALGYAVWEWHDEMGKFFRKRYMSMLRFARVRK